MHEWKKLMDILDNVVISEGEDTFSWILEKSGQYSTKSMHRRLSFRGIVNRRMVKLWKNKIPMKIRVFMWLVMQGRLQTGSNLKKKQWRGTGKCCLCGAWEDENHIFFFGVF